MKLGSDKNKSASSIDIIYEDDEEPTTPDLGEDPEGSSNFLKYACPGYILLFILSIVLVSALTLNNS